jgi:chromosome segregation ATPase
LQKLKQENDQLRAIIGERDEDLKVYQEAVAELKGELEDANEEIEELEGMLRSSKRKVEEGDNDIKERDKSLVDLQT